MKKLFIMIASVVVASVALPAASQAKYFTGASKRIVGGHHQAKPAHKNNGLNHRSDARSVKGHPTLQQTHRHHN